MPKKALNTTLSFTADFQQKATEILKPGADVTILFDPARLPFERSVSEKGKPEWSISAYYQLLPEETVNEVKLATEKAAKGKDTQGKIFLKGVFTIPAETSEVIIWFLNTGKSGQAFFDSNFGKNYHFPVAADITETPAPAKKARAKKA